MRQIERRCEKTGKTVCKRCDPWYSPYPRITERTALIIEPFRAWYTNSSWNVICRTVYGMLKASRVQYKCSSWMAFYLKLKCKTHIHTYEMVDYYLPHLAHGAIWKFSDLNFMFILFPLAAPLSLHSAMQHIWSGCLVCTMYACVLTMYCIDCGNYNAAND